MVQPEGTHVIVAGCVHSVIAKKRSDEAISWVSTDGDCFAALAMTDGETRRDRNRQSPAVFHCCHSSSGIYARWRLSRWHPLRAMWSTQEMGKPATDGSGTTQSVSVKGAPGDAMLFVPVAV